MPSDYAQDIDDWLMGAEYSPEKLAILMFFLRESPDEFSDIAKMFALIKEKPRLSMFSAEEQETFKQAGHLLFKSMTAQLEAGIADGTV